MGIRKTVLIMLLSLALTGAAQAALVGYWPMNDGTGTLVTDLTKDARNATLTGGPTWVAGQFGLGVKFDGTDDYVDLPIGPLMATLTDCTFAVWTNWTGQSGAWSRIWDFGNSSTNGYMFLCANAVSATGTMRFAITPSSNGNEQVTNHTASLPTGWHHVTVTMNHATNTAQLWLDGAVVGTNTSTTLTPSSLGSTTQNYLGRSQWPDPYWSGVQDDFRIYDKALTEAEIQEVMTGYSPFGGTAVSPVPADNASDVLRDTGLSWTAGTYAGTHNVYFGTSFDDVNAASLSSPLLLSQGGADPAYDLPGVLDFGKTYYWRVDEVNATPDHAVYKGSVWSFTVEPFSIPIADVNATASSSGPDMGASKMVDGSGMDPNTDAHSTTPTDMWTSGMGLPQWVQFKFDKAYKLDQMAVWNSNQTMESLYGFSAKDVLVQYSLDGAEWTDLGTFKLKQAPGLATYVTDNKVPFGGVPAQYVKVTINSVYGVLLPMASISEVRFYAIPVAAREPSPGDETTDVYPQVPLTWRAGREAASHEVYVSTDANAVANGTAAKTTVSQARFDVAANLESTYYWKVVEVNQAMSPASWAGPVWSFSTGTYINFDDFESYTNDSPKRVFQTWIDGSGFSIDEFFPTGSSGNGTGSLVGNDPTLGDIMEKTYFYAGKQSMPLFYDNSTGSKISEATRTLDPAKEITDWSKYGLTTLVVHFLGDATNGAAPVYVKINNTKKVYGVAAATTITYWRQWNIDLTSFPAADLKAVKTITIGVGDGSAAGTGTIRVDDIRLYANAPAIPVPTNPGTTGLIAYYAMNGDVTDGSGNGNNGTIVGEASFADGMAGFGKALALDGVNDCVDLGKKDVFNPTGSFSVSIWANLGAWGTAWGHVMIGNRGESAIGWQIRRHSGTGLCFTTRGVDQDDTPSAMTPPLNEWMNIVCVYDDAASTKTIYIDGHKDTVVNTTAGKHIAATTHNTFIGARAAAGNTAESFFTGQLDEIRLFNRVLTAGEAAYLAGDR